MIKNGYDFSEIDDLLLAHRKEERSTIFGDNFDKLLGQLIHDGQTELFEKLFDSLVKYNLIEPKV